MLHVTEPPSACRVRCCRPSSFSAASDSAAVADRSLAFVGQCSFESFSADWRRTVRLFQQIGIDRSFSAAQFWRRTVRLLPIELVRSSLGTVPLLRIELILCKHKTLCMACISRAQLSLATDHSVLGSRSSTVDFLCAEPEGVLTMQSCLPHITHQHLHEPREHQQHELIPHQLAHLAQQCGRFGQVAEHSSLSGMEPKQSMSVGSEPARSTPRTSSCSTGSDGDLTTTLSTSQSCERSDHCLGTTCGSTETPTKRFTESWSQ